MVKSPTRANNILDLILTNVPEVVSSVLLTGNLNGTDHEAISFNISVSVNSSHQCPYFLYNYKKADFDHLKSVLSHVPWDVIDFSGDIEVSWSMWKDLFFSAVDMVAPKTKWKKHKVT